jgi:hypothetical protein
VIEAARSAAPPAVVRVLMDRCVPPALLSGHPDVAAREAEWARLVMYARSHWVKMPPWMLVRHLSYKFYVTQTRRRTEES